MNEKNEHSVKSTSFLENGTNQMWNFLFELQIRKFNLIMSVHRVRANALPGCFCEGTTGRKDWIA